MMSDRIVKFIVLATILIFGGCATQQPQLKYPDLVVKQVGDERWAVLPPDVIIFELSLTNSGFLLTDQISAKAVELEEMLEVNISCRLGNSEVVSFSRETLREQYDSEHLWRAAIAELALVLNSEEKFEDRMFVARELGEVLDVDWLFIPQFYGYKTTNAQKAANGLFTALVGIGTMGLVVPVFSSSAEKLKITLVNATSGQVYDVTETFSAGCSE